MAEIPLPQKPRGLSQKKARILITILVVIAGIASAVAYDPCLSKRWWGDIPSTGVGLGYVKLSPREGCYWEKAMATNDAQRCLKIRSENAYDCVVTIAYVRRDPSVCRILEKSDDKNSASACERYITERIPKPIL